MALPLEVEVNKRSSTIRRPQLRIIQLDHHLIIPLSIKGKVNLTLITLHKSVVLGQDVGRVCLRKSMMMSLLTARVIIENFFRVFRIGNNIRHLISVKAILLYRIGKEEIRIVAQISNSIPKQLIQSALMPHIAKEIFLKSMRKGRTLISILPHLKAIKL